MPLSSRKIGAALRRHILLPAYFKYVKHSRVFECLHELRAQQWNSLEENRAIQARKLYQLLKYASENISYYKTVVQERGIKIREDRIFDDLKKFPFLTKKIIREHFDELYRFRDNTYYRNTSGGSTGEPVVFYQDGTYHDWGQAGMFLFYEWAGRDIGSPIVKLWGSERDILRRGTGLKAYLSSRLHGEVLLNSFRMANEDMYRYVQTLNRLRPHVIHAYASSIDELAQFIAQEGMSVYSPRSIITSAGVLYPEVRARIEKIFRATAYNQYGSREVGSIACECSEHEGMHLIPRLHYIELIKEDGTLITTSGNDGQLVVTSLTNYTMPFIRYRIGDRAKWGRKNCSCGRGWPVLGAVTGRTSSIFRTPDGRAIDGTALTTVFYDFNSISKYQVLQEQLDALEVKIVVDPQATREHAIDDKEKIAQKLRVIFGSAVVLKVHFVDDIAPSASGKYCYMISKVSREQD